MIDSSNLITTFFEDLEAYENFYHNGFLMQVYSEDRQYCAELLNESDKYFYRITHVGSERFTGELIKKFYPIQENLDRFNLGCHKMSINLQLYIITNNPDFLADDVSAFGRLAILVH